MKTVTPTQLRANIYKLLEEVLTTGIPIEIKKGSKRLRIIPADHANKLDNLVFRPEVIQGDPEELVNLSWEEEVNFDLP